LAFCQALSKSGFSGLLFGTAGAAMVLSMKIMGSEKATRRPSRSVATQSNSNGAPFTQGQNRTWPKGSLAFLGMRLAGLSGVSRSGVRGVRMRTRVNGNWCPSRIFWSLLSSCGSA